MRRTFPIYHDVLHDRAALMQLARCLVRDAADADDLVQDALVIALEGGRTDPELDRAWVRGVLRNLARRTWRTRRRRRRRETRVANPNRLPDSTLAVSHAETRRALSEGIAVLPDAYRIPLKLCYFDGLTPQAIATEMGLTPSTVRTRLQRGRERLRRQLEGRFGSARDALGAALIPLAIGRMPDVPGAAVAAGEGAAATSLAMRVAAAVCAAVLIVVPATVAPPADDAASALAHALRVDGAHTLTVMVDPAADASGTPILADAAGADRVRRLDRSGAATDATAPATRAAQGDAAAPALPVRGVIAGEEGPAAGAIVAAYRLGADGPDGTPTATTVADAHGAFELGVVRDGKWLVVAALPGRLPTSTVVDGSGAGATVALTLERGLTAEARFPVGAHAGADTQLIATVRTGETSGRVISMGDAQPELVWSGGVLRWRHVNAQVSADGRVQASGLHAGDYVVELSARSTADESAPRTLGRAKVRILPPEPAPVVEEPVAETSSRETEAPDTEAPSQETPRREQANESPDTAPPAGDGHISSRPRDADEWTEGWSPPTVARRDQRPAGSAPIHVEVITNPTQILLPQPNTGAPVQPVIPTPPPTVPEPVVPATPPSLPGVDTTPVVPDLPSPLDPIDLDDLPSTPEAPGVGRDPGAGSGQPAAGRVSPAWLQLAHEDPARVPQIYVVELIQPMGHMLKTAMIVDGIVLVAGEAPLPLAPGVYRIRPYEPQPGVDRVLLVTLLPGEHMVLPASLLP